MDAEGVLTPEELKKVIRAAEEAAKQRRNGDDLEQGEEKSSLLEIEEKVIKHVEGQILSYKIELI